MPDVTFYELFFMQISNYKPISANILIKLLSNPQPFLAEAPMKSECPLSGLLLAVIEMKFVMIRFHSQLRYLLLIL
jgi:hypothetical protein